MRTPRTTIVVTTINVPYLLRDYAENFGRFDVLDHIETIIIGDRKTPHADLHALANELSAQGLRTRYVDLAEQERYLERFPELARRIPFNSDNRRNIGYLMAAEGGAESIVALDDDNWVYKHENWYEGHALVGETRRTRTVRCSNGWFNPCSMMSYNVDAPIFARGYPYSKRIGKNVHSFGYETGRIVINGGLWLGDPDVDSLTRLTFPVRAERVLDDRLVLADGTFAPINTQNTSFHRDVIPAFYFVPVGDSIGGVPVERYGDIWAGFFAAKAIHGTRDRIAFGAPACDHRRNAHNLLGDLELEFWSIELTDPLAEMLESWTLSGSTYCERYLEIADHLEAAEWKHKRMAGSFKQFFVKMADSMRVWVEACRSVGLEGEVPLVARDPEPAIA